VTAKKTPRPVAIGLALAAGLALIVGAFSHDWLRNGFDDVRFGLLSVRAPALPPTMPLAARAAFRGDCAGVVPPDVCSVSTARYLEVELAAIDALELARRTDPERYQDVASLLAAAALLASVGIALGHARPELPVLPTTIALVGLMAALVCGCVFVATKPDEHGWLGVGWSFFTFGGGCVAGLAGAIFVNREIRPADPDLAQMSMAWRGEL
jgi:hypothetical protein